MTNKNPLEQLIARIGTLSGLIEEIQNKELYPVAFFSQAFDLTYKIQQDLHQIEIAQISLIEQRMREHKEQIGVRPPLQKPKPAVQPPSPPPSSPAPAPKTAPKEKEHLPDEAAVGKKTLPDVKKLFSLNDRFRFSRELFSHDEQKMNHAIAELNELHSLQESVAYLKVHFDWNLDEGVAADFLQCLEKRFI
jgi:hypothetical protein